jgi:hypothetical protein
MTPEERAARRAVIKAHHPDRGGDPARFVELLDEIERSHGGRSAAHAVDVRPSGHGRRRRRQIVRQLRRRLPRHVPGARRYATY